MAEVARDRGAVRAGAPEDGAQDDRGHGRIREDMVDIYAHILLASLIEVAFLTARSADPAAAAAEGRLAMRELLDRLISPASRAAGTPSGRTRGRRRHR